MGVRLAARVEEEGAFPKVLDALEMAIGPRNVDFLEITAVQLVVHSIFSIPMRLISPFVPSGFCFLSSLGLGLAAHVKYVEEFKRPLIQRKIEALQKSSAGHEKKALILESDSDFFGAFSTRAFVSNATELAKQHAIQRVNVTTETGLQRSFRYLPESTYDVVWVRAHGSKESVGLGTDFEIVKDSKILGDLSGKVKKGAKVILESCSVACGNENIAKSISSQCSSATLYAPETMIHGVLGLEIDSDGSARFNDGWFFKGKDVTRIYKPRGFFSWLFGR